MVDVGFYPPTKDRGEINLCSMSALIGQSDARYCYPTRLLLGLLATVCGVVMYSNRICCCHSRSMTWRLDVQWILSSGGCPAIPGLGGRGSLVRHITLLVSSVRFQFGARLFFCNKTWARMIILAHGLSNINMIYRFLGRDNPRIAAEYPSKIATSRVTI